MKIYLDMDGVLADLMAGWMPYLNEVSGRNLAVEDVDMWGIEHVYGIPFSKARKPLHREGFWEGLPPYPGAVAFVKRLDQLGHMVYIATAPFPSDKCMWGKKMWFENHLRFLPPSRLIILHDKHLLRGDMLVDDKPENLTKFPGLRVLFNQPWNRTLNKGLMESWYIRVSSFKEVVSITQDY